VKFTGLFLTNPLGIHPKSLNKPSVCTFVPNATIETK
jgi:hypothetical protein